MASSETRRCRLQQGTFNEQSKKLLASMVAPGGLFSKSCKQTASQMRHLPLTKPLQQTLTQIMDLSHDEVQLIEIWRSMHTPIYAADSSMRVTRSQLKLHAGQGNVACATTPPVASPALHLPTTPNTKRRGHTARDSSLLGAASGSEALMSCSLAGCGTLALTPQRVRRSAPTRKTPVHEIQTPPSQIQRMDMIRTPPVVPIKMLRTSPVCEPSTTESIARLPVKRKLLFHGMHHFYT